MAIARPGPERARTAAAVTLFVLLAIGGLGSIAGLVGWLHWLPELAAPFRLQLGFVLVAAGGIALAIDKRFVATAALVLAAADLGVVAQSWVPEQSRQAPSGRDLRVMLATVGRDAKPLLRLVRAADPDVLALEEVDRDALDELEELGPRFPWSRVEPREDMLGVALYSKLRLEESSIEYFGDTGVPSILARADVDGRPVTFVLVRSVPPIGTGAARLRDAQVEALAKAPPKPGARVVLLGNLAASPWSPPFERLRESWRLADTRRGHGYQGTWPVQPFLLRVPLDHVLVSEGLLALDRQVGPDVGATHLPVRVVLRLADPAR